MSVAVLAHCPVLWACCSLPFLVAMASWQEDSSYASSGWQARRDRDSNSGWQDSTSQSSGGGGAHSGGWGSGSWDVNPGSPPQGQLWPMCRTLHPAQPPYPPPDRHRQVPERRQPPGPPPVELLPGCQIGYQKGYDAACNDMWTQTQKQSRAASSDWWEGDDQGGSDGGEKKKQKKQTSLGGPSNSGSRTTTRTTR